MNVHEMRKGKSFQMLKMAAEAGVGVRLITPKQTVDMTPEEVREMVAAALAAGEEN